MADSYYPKQSSLGSDQKTNKIKLIDNGDDTFSIAVASGTSGRSGQIEGRKDDISAGTFDIWEGTDATIPIPSPSGQQMAIKSTNIADIAGGDGVREVALEYVDVNGDAQIELITMNGTTEVLTVATDIIMVNDFYATKNGNIANNNKSSAFGDITIYEIGNTSLVYNVIKAGNNKSSSTLRMIPANTVYQIDALIVSGDTKGITVNLRVNESDTGVETEGFLYRIPMTIGDSPAPITFPTSIRVSAGRLIKATATVPTEASGGDVSYLISGRLDTLPKQIIEEIVQILFDWSTVTENNQRYLVDSGTLSGNALLESGQGKYFNGVDQYIDVGKYDFSSDFTVCINYKSLSVSGARVLWLGDYHISIVDDGVLIYNGITNKINFSSVDFVFLCLERSGDLFSVYLDNVFYDSLIVQNVTQVNQNTYIANRPAYGYANTIIKDLYIFNRMLTEAERTKQYEQPEQFFSDVLIDNTCILNMPMNDKGNNCRDYVSNTDYPISNFLTATNTNAQNLTYGLQDTKLITDGLGIISGASNFFKCNGISKATIPTNARKSNIELVVNPSELTGNILSGAINLDTTGLILNQDNTINLNNQTINGEITLGNDFKGTIKSYKEIKA